MRRVRKNDTVEVIAGRDKGKRGKVLRILPKKDRVIVEKVMMVKKHVKPTAKNPQQGGIIETEGSIHISNVMPIDPATDKPTRVRVSVEGGTKRVGKSGSSIEASIS